MAAPEVRILTAPGDGTGPSALLTFPHVRPAVQYLFRAPDGMSRLVLEQGQRPGLGLRAIFTCNRGYSQVRALPGGPSLCLTFLPESGLSCLPPTTIGRACRSAHASACRRKRASSLTWTARWAPGWVALGWWSAACAPTSHVGKNISRNSNTVFLTRFTPCILTRNNIRLA